MNSHIEELILLKKRQEGYLNIPSKERLIKIKKDYGGLFDFNAKANEISDKIIKDVFNDKITLENITEIPDRFLEREKILKKVTDYLNEKEALEVLEIEISTENKFRRICEASLQDGILSPSEEKNISFEASILGVEKDRAALILQKVQNELEIAKPKELILEVLSEGQKKTLDEMTKEITSNKYGVKMSKSEIFILLKEMNREVVFEDSTNTYFLVSSIKSESTNSFQYRSTKYNYSLEELPRNTPYVTFNSSPQTQECSIFINTKNKYFKNTPPQSVLRDVLFDAVAYHQMQKINTDSVIDPTRQLLKFKEDIGYSLSNESFETTAQLKTS